MRTLTVAAPLALLLALAAPLAAETLDREYRFAPDQVRLVRGKTSDQLVAKGSLPELTAGQPEWPWLAQVIDLPARVRVSGVELISIQTEPWEKGVRLPSAWMMGEKGLSIRSTPDAQAFAHVGFQPDRAVELGGQGYQRGQNRTTLRICPVRWDATTGALERVTSVRVRLQLEPTTDGAVERLRRGPWDGPKSGTTVYRRTGGLGGPGMSGTLSAPQLPSILGNPIAYVIITNDDMAPQFQRLADWKTQTGMPAVVRTMSFIRANYPRGSDDAERIRDFIRDAYSRWGTDYVLLGGDTEVIPTRLAHSNYYTGDDIATDMYYSCLEGNWDGDGDHIYGEPYLSEETLGDGVDLFPEVYVGRAPVTTLLESQKFVDRTLQYIKTPVGDYEKNVLIFAEVLFPEDWAPGDGELLDGAELGDELLPHIHDNLSMRSVRLYQNYTDPTWVPGALQETKKAVIDSLNKGYGFAVHIGHGYRNVMSLGDANMFNGEALGLTNGNRQFNLYAINCTSNAIDFPCIGESFLHAPAGGAVTSVGSTRLDFPYAGRLFEQEYFRLVFDDSVSAAGEAQALQKVPQIAQSETETAYRWMQFSLLLLGDPELRMWTGTPRTMAVTHAAGMLVSDSTFAVTVLVGGQPVVGARVVAYKPNEAYVIGFTNGAGQVTLPVRSDSTGTFTLTVTSYDAKPYQATINVNNSALAVLADGVPVIDDDAVSGTDGDNDGFWDAGETIDIRIPLRNNATGSANNVNGSMTSPDTTVTVLAASQGYGTIASGAQVTSAGAFRVRLSPTAKDQAEVRLNLLITATGAPSRTQVVRLITRSPELRQFAHQVLDPGGNVNGRPDPGEAVTMTTVLKNLGTGDAHGVTAVLRNVTGTTVTDSTASWGNLAASEERNASDSFAFSVSSANAVVELHVSDSRRKQLIHRIDIGYPAGPAGLAGMGLGTGITLEWTENAEPDLLGYNVYRSLNSGGPFARINLVPTDRIATYVDAGLTPLTRYYYRVTAVDSSGNESSAVSTASASTNPPHHGFFPIPMNASSFAPVTVEHLSPGYALDILSGSDFIYAWHPDGLAVTDADGGGSTNGDFTVRGSNYEGGVSVGDINNDGLPDVVGVGSDSTRVVALDRTGALLPGWPKIIADRSWSSMALGDLDNDNDREIVFGGFTNPRVYAFRPDGTELIDGDANPGTLGVFKVIGSPFNIGTPAIADLDGNGTRDIIMGGFDGKLYAWRPNGTNMPGFPITLPEPVSSSVAIGYLDGPGDVQLDIVVVTGYYPNPTPSKDSLYVFTATGARRAGFPKVLRASDGTKAPSPALADMNNDGFLDIVAATTTGKLFVYDRNGAIVGPWNNVPYSALTSSSSEASPVVADIDGDGLNDIVIGDEAGNLNAIGGTGTPLPGFPIQLEASIKSAAALCDCDGDGMSEIVVSGSDRNVVMWDYDFPFSPGVKPAWPQFHHDAMRTGLYSNPSFVDVLIPTAGGEPAARLELAVPQPNPSSRGASMSYAIPRVAPGTRLELGVYDLSGRLMRTLVNTEAKPGRGTATWNLKDDGGRRVEPGIYFMRLRVGEDATARKIIVMN